MTDERFIAIDGRRLRKLRRERALSQLDLTRTTGVAQATLSDLEQGKRGGQGLYIEEARGGVGRGASRAYEGGVRA